MKSGDLLTAAMGYPIKIPTAPITRSVRLLFKDRASLEPYMERRKYIPIKYREEKKQELGESHKRILKVINKLGSATAADVCKGTKWTQNHCSMILTSLYNKGLVRRRKASGNGTRWYVYMKKEGV